MPDAAVAGVHGKLPARGDFVTRNLPLAFVTAWDAWLQAGVAISRDQLGDAWLATYLESPIWRFVLASGLCGPGAWAGVLMPSVDKVGRYFPLTIAGPLDAAADPMSTAVVAAPWFEGAEALALRALHDDHLDLEAFVKEVAGLAGLASAPAAPPSDRTDPAGTGWCLDLDAAAPGAAGLAAVADRLLLDGVRPLTLWWTVGGPRLAPHCCVLPHMLPAERFRHLLAGAARPGAAEAG